MNDCLITLLVRGKRKRKGERNTKSYAVLHNSLNISRQPCGSVGLWDGAELKCLPGVRARQMARRWRVEAG